MRARYDIYTLYFINGRRCKKKKHDLLPWSQGRAKTRKSADCTRHVGCEKYYSNVIRYLATVYYNERISVLDKMRASPEYVYIRYGKRNIEKLPDHSYAQELHFYNTCMPLTQSC